MEMLEVKNLSFTYPGQQSPVLDGISFPVAKGDFLTICGETGSGKTTLLRLLKRELAPIGTRSGEITWRGISQVREDGNPAPAAIGFVLQRPEEQIVTDRVWHELAFGPENMGLPREAIRRRVSEMAAYFGMDDLFESETTKLSGGQKQLLNLAAIMVMQPEVLLLDEPTAQLDPIAAENFLTAVSRLNREFGLTVIMIEHRTEQVLAVSDRLLFLRAGHLLACGQTRETVQKVCRFPEILEGMPAAVRLYARLALRGVPCPLTVREGQRMIETRYDNRVRSLPHAPYRPSGREALRFSSVFFRYEKSAPDVLRDLSFAVYEQEIFCILGGNGSGKSTAIAVAAGLLMPYAGSVRVFGKKCREYKNQTLYRSCLSLLPQDVQTAFLCNTVREELADAGADADTLPFDVSPWLDRHPYDLSGGQQQLLAMAKVLAQKPRLLLLDEPTKGLDAHAKAEWVAMLRRLREGGMTVVVVTHDVELAAACADRCALFFRGEITSVDVPDRFFSGNRFYTTAASRMTRGYYDGIVTVEEAERICRANEMQEEGADARRSDRGVNGKASEKVNDETSKKREGRGDDCDS